MSLPSLKWAASPNFRAGRAGQKLDLIVVHRCEGSGPGTVAYFQTRAADVSAQFVVGEKGAWITQMVHVADTAWHACAFNGRSVGIEPAGYSKDGFDDGLLSTLAELVAYLCHYLQIPVRHARGGVGPGVELHWGLGRAGGGHSDPSTDPNWIPDVFLPKVQAAYHKADFDPNWLHQVDEGLAPCRLSPPASPRAEVDDRGPSPGLTRASANAAIGAAPAVAPLAGAPKRGVGFDPSTVLGVQKALNALGARLHEDGDLGPATVDAIKAFQRRSHLEVDGVVGPATQKAILKDLSGD